MSALLIISVLVVGAPAAGAASSWAGAFQQVSPARILDTGAGNGVPAAAVPANGSVTVQVSGRGGIPASGAGSVALNLVAGSGTAVGYVTAYPAGHTRPATTNLDYIKGQTIANLVVVPLGSGGKVTFYNQSSGTVRLIADTEGYYLSGAGLATGVYNTVTPTRILDTGTGNGAPSAAVAANGSITVQIGGRGGIPASGAGTVLLNLVAGSSTATGYITAYPAGQARPGTTNLDYTKSETIAVLVAVPLGVGGKVTLYNQSSGTVRLIADTQGYFVSGTTPGTGAYQPVAPTRILDTGTGNGVPAAAVPANGSITVQVGGRGGIPNPGADSVVLNLVAGSGTANGYITAYPANQNRPATTNLDYTKAKTIANLVVVPLESDGKITLYNQSSGTVRLIADTQGYYGKLGFAISPTPSLANAATLAAVSCPSAAFCMAVGDNARESWNGTTWALATTTGAAALYAVSCTAPTFCIGVGRDVESWNGTAWSLFPPVTANTLSAVSCVSTTFCVAVGDSTFEMWNGIAWKVGGFGPVASRLMGVSCRSATTCVAVGTVGTATLTEAWNGQAWTVVPSPSRGPTDILLAVSCATTTACLAVGQTRESTGVETLVEYWNGATWRIVPSTNPSGGGDYPYDSLASVSCASPIACTAVGEQTTDGGQPSVHTTLVETRDGTATSTFGAANVPDTTSVLRGVSCPAPTLCAAVGTSGYSVDSSERPLIEQT